MQLQHYACDKYTFNVNDKIVNKLKIDTWKWL